MVLSHLGIALRTRYVQGGRPEDLEEAIGFLERAVKAAPEGSPHWPLWLDNLAIGVSDRFDLKGRHEDLEAAVRYSYQAAAAMPKDSPEVARCLGNLGDLLRQRFERTGRLEDLDEAIRVCERAVTAMPEGSADRAMSLNNLGAGRQRRYQWTTRLADLQEAIRVFERAQATCPAGSPTLPGILSNLGAALRDRFLRIGQVEDSEMAIRTLERAVAATPEGSPHLAGYFSSLANCLCDRFRRTERLQDVTEAVRLFERAVALTPEESPSLGMHLNNLGIGLQERFARTTQRDDLESAVRCYRRACELGAISDPQSALCAARNWGRWAVQRKQWGEIAEAYGYGLATGRQLLGRQLLREQKESVLRDLQEMSGPAAYALAKLERFEEAVETAERGRARLLAEALHRNRCDLEQLPTLGHADLYERYREIVETQERLKQPAAARRDQPDHLSSQARIRAVVAANAAFDQVVAEVQKVPGYSDFLAEPSFAKIQAAAKGTPLVYLPTTSTGGLALIVSANKVQPVWLDALTDARVLEWLRGPADQAKVKGWVGTYRHWLDERTEQARDAWFANLDDITRQLGVHLMEPVAAALRRVLPVDPSCAPEVTLIPAGLLGLLPMHAAWIEDASTPTQRRYFLDEFTVRYAPSALALSYCRQRATASKGQRLLTIDEPRPITGGGPLPNAAGEVAAVASLFPDNQVLQHQSATRSAALGALATAHIAHFACHGFNDWQNPLASGLLMAKDELLTVRDILEKRLPEGRLATLSACETGIVGTGLPDEVVMLASALVQAGYAGVVASLWSVADVSTAMLMVRFYQFWRVGHLEPVHALREAQRWLRDSTNREKADYFRQFVPSLVARMPELVAADFFSAADLGKGGPDARSLSHPYWWAAFYLTGV